MNIKTKIMSSKLLTTLVSLTEKFMNKLDRKCIIGVNYLHDGLKFISVITYE